LSFTQIVNIIRYSFFTFILSPGMTGRGGAPQPEEEIPTLRTGENLDIIMRMQRRKW